MSTLTRPVGGLTVVDAGLLTTGKDLQRLGGHDGPGAVFYLRSVSDVSVTFAGPGPGAACHAIGERQVPKVRVDLGRRGNRETHPAAGSYDPWPKELDHGKIVFTILTLDSHTLVHWRTPDLRIVPACDENMGCHRWMVGTTGRQA